MPKMPHRQAIWLYAICSTDPRLCRVFTHLLLRVMIEHVKQGQKGSAGLPSRLPGPIQDDAVHQWPCRHNLQEDEEEHISL